MSELAIVWFRRDLRLADNPALTKAVETGSVLPVYIFDENDSDQPPRGSASSVWLHHSLENLNRSLGGKLLFFRGDPRQVLPALASAVGATHVFWNRCYTPHRVTIDERIKSQLQTNGVEVKSFNGSLLWEPWQVTKPDGSPYKVFTPFYRKGCLNAETPRETLPAPASINFAEVATQSAALEALDLVPRKPWANEVIKGWKVGEEGARAAWGTFVDHGLDGYKTGRNFPNKPNVSRLSPHLAFGEVSPHQIWAALAYQKDSEDVAHFRSELAWREFSYYLLFHFDGFAVENFNAKFDRFSWAFDSAGFEKWRHGETGIPIVDAGMRELWQTGYMHNRVRMIVASFLTKNLLLDWRLGAEWFEFCLFDADRANNRASWQWVAGCGADAAPYFRIFNPVTQSEKFDAAGDYVRRFVPEIAALPDNFLAKPFEAPHEILRQAGIELGRDYPLPIVDLKQSRSRALDAFAALKTAAE